MNIETLTEHMKEVWLGDLIEASFGARREQMRRWACIFILRLCAVILVFGAPWMLMKAPAYSASWMVATVAEVGTCVFVAQRCWMARSRTFFGYGLFVAITCALVVGWSASAAPMWLSAPGGLLAASLACRLLAVGEGTRD